MKITLSRAQWEALGKQAGWLTPRSLQTPALPDNPNHTQHAEFDYVCDACGGVNWAGIHGQPPQACEFCSAEGKWKKVPAGGRNRLPQPDVAAPVTAKSDGEMKLSWSVPDQHQLRILIDNLKNPLKAKFLGGPSVEESESILREKFGYTDAMINKLKGTPSAGFVVVENPGNLVVPDFSACNTIYDVEDVMRKAFPDKFVYRGGHHVSVHPKANDPERLLMVGEKDRVTASDKKMSKEAQTPMEERTRRMDDMIERQEQRDWEREHLPDPYLEAAREEANRRAQGACPKCGCLEHNVLNPSMPIVNECTKCKHKWNPDNERAASSEKWLRSALRVKEEDLVDCGQCSGTGIGMHGDPDRSKCPRCKGRGAVLSDEAQEREDAARDEAWEAKMEARREASKPGAVKTAQDMDIYPADEIDFQDEQAALSNQSCPQCGGIGCGGACVYGDELQSMLRVVTAYKELSEAHDSGEMLTEEKFRSYEGLPPMGNDLTSNFNLLSDTIVKQLTALKQIEAKRPGLAAGRKQLMEEKGLTAFMQPFEDAT